MQGLDPYIKLNAKRTRGQNLADGWRSSFTDDQVMLNSRRKSGAKLRALTTHVKLKRAVSGDRRIKFRYDHKTLRLFKRRALAVSTIEIAFTKMNGLGNDFVVLDSRGHAISLNAQIVQGLADRKNPHTGGCDQLLNILPPRAQGTVFMEIFNADGSRVGACGNGTRAVAVLLGMPECVIETDTGQLACTLNEANMVTVNMGAPRLAATEIPVTDAGINPRAVNLHDDLPPACLVNMGNPHAVIFITDDPQGMALKYGPALEHHPMFPERANINFCRPLSQDHLELATWERGAGLTKACGTGACATAVAHALEHGFHAGAFRQIDVPGGSLDLRYDTIAAPVWMRGTAMIDFAGQTSIKLTGAAHD